MLIVMENRATKEEIKRVSETVRALGLEAHEMPGAQRTAICVTGNDGSVSERHFAGLTGIRDIIRVSKPYKLTSNEIKTTPTIVRIGQSQFGDGHTGLIAGPLCVEDESTFEVAQAIKAQGIHCFRAAAFKDRTNPYNFHGLGAKALPILKRIKEELGLAIVTEVSDEANVDVVADIADAVIVEPHNMQNFSLLKYLGKTNLPVILKRAISANLEDVLMAAEYILAGFNEKVILCEAGIQTFANYSTHTLDLTIVPALRHYTHLPIIVDPSFACGDSKYVMPLAKAAMAVGADGVMIECHTNPAKALSGGAQAVDVQRLQDLI